MTQTRPATAGRWEMGTRTVSGLVLIAAVVLAVIGGRLVFAVLVAIGALVALREWHRLLNARREARETIFTGLSVIGAIALVHFNAAPVWPVAALAAGAGLTALSAAQRHTWVLWHVLGGPYIGIPALALVALRDNAAGGGVIVAGVFVAVWAADTGALFTGRLMGGPRLAPKLSPNKTWSGFAGGLVAALLAEAVYTGIFGGSVWLGALFGLFLGLAAHGGDLFESWVKRSFQAKNTGTLIPGHGGMLDRVDSMVFAAPAAALLLFLTGANIFGAMP